MVSPSSATFALTVKTVTPPLGVPPGSQPVQPPSTTTVCPLLLIVRFLASVSVPLVSVIGLPLGQSTLKLIVVPLAAAAISPRNEPSPLTPLSVQFVTVRVGDCAKHGIWKT